MCHLAEQLFVDGESQVQVGRVVVQDPLQGVEVLTVLKRNTARTITVVTPHTHTHTHTQ